MTGYDATKPLISVHIPKCAGSSFRAVLEGWFAEHLLLHYYDESSNQPPAIAPLWGVAGNPKIHHKTCVHGHFNTARGNGVKDYYPFADQVITIMRDPFEIQVSNYFYVKHMAEQSRAGALSHGKPHDIIANDWTLEQWLELGPPSPLLYFLPTSLNQHNFKEILESEFIYIGTTEYLSKSVADLATLLDFPLPTLKLVNDAPRQDPIEPLWRERFQDLHALEYSIYDYVVTRSGHAG